MQDLLQQWSYSALIIATQFSQVYQQTKSLGYSRCRITRQGLWLKKEERSHKTASQGTSLATHKILLPVQDCDSCLLPFWRIFTSLPLCTYKLSCFLWYSHEKLLKIPKSHIIRTMFFQFHGTICLEFTAGHSKKCTNIIPVQISHQNLPVCPSFTVESSNLFEKRLAFLCLTCWM